MPARDCPMCGETMRLRLREGANRVPGTLQTTATSYREWVCPECDYFEEAEDGDSGD